MASTRLTQSSLARPLRLAAALGGIAVLALSLAACTAQGGTKPQAAVDEPGFDPLKMTWSPRALKEATPCLVGWRDDGRGGALVSLTNEDLRDPVLWQVPPNVGAGQISLLGVDPVGRRMVGAYYAQAWGEEPTEQDLLFEADGSVRALPRPEGYEGLADVTFVDGGILTLAYHATLEDYQTVPGLVAADGKWTQLTIEGDMPNHLFIEACTARPGSDLVGLVLKTPGGVGDRDDFALVLARLEGSTLTVVTPAFLDDSLEYARSLWQADGVEYPRMWAQTGGVPAPTPVRVGWTGTEWRETEILPPGTVGIGAETGQVIAEDSAGGEWIRDAGPNVRGVDSVMRYLPAGATALESTGVQMGQVDWFTWVEGTEQ